jgi:hypothetical protein
LIGGIHGFNLGRHPYQYTVGQILCLQAGTEDGKYFYIPLLESRSKALPFKSQFLKAISILFTRVCKNIGDNQPTLLLVASTAAIATRCLGRFE